jgi:hypothetical protein
MALRYPEGATILQVRRTLGGPNLYGAAALRTTEHTIAMTERDTLHGCGHCLHCTEDPKFGAPFNSISPLRPYLYLQRECHT